MAPRLVPGSEDPETPITRPALERAGRGSPTAAPVAVAEFDKFLEERAKAAEMVPDLPSPPSEAPAPAAGHPSGRKKPERSEDALFAL